MPKKAEKALRAEARKKGFTGERLKAYVYGGLRNLGWTPSHQKKKKLEKEAMRRRQKRT